MSVHHTSFGNNLHTRRDKQYDLVVVRLKAWVFFFFEGAGVGGISGNLFGVQKSNTACFAWSLFNFMELNARCACEKDSIVTVMLIFLFTGIDSTK